jgi:quercetin dioxygenase-like cupin family protein
MLEPIRRVVTGHDVAGRSIVLFDSHVSPKPELPTDTCLWITDRTPASLADRADAADRPNRLEPPRNGSAFRFVEFPPVSAFAGMSPEAVERAMAAVFEQLGATHARIDTARGPGMHRTRTVDYVIVLAGQITLLLDEGEVDLKPFDVVVQRGTNHGWENRGTTPTLLAAVMIDAEPIGR